MRIARIAAVAVAVASAAGVLTGCGGTNHDSLNPTVDIQIHWWRLETPPSVVTEYFGCLGRDGLILDQGDGNVSVTPDDRMCPAKGAPYQLVQRHNSDPVVVIGTYNLIPPDDTGKWDGTPGRA